MPQFSVIIPIYNAEKYLQTCIESILNQTFTDFELILVNDGSTDSSELICSRYKNQDKRIKFINKLNEGQIITRACGTNSATGDYLIFIDSDDYVAENYLYEMSKIITQYSPDIICCSYFETDGKVETFLKNELPEGFYCKDKIKQTIFDILIENENCEYFSNSLCLKVFKQDLYKKHHLDQGWISAGGDAVCVKPCVFNANSIYSTPQAFYYYRYNPLSITKGKSVYKWSGPKLIAQHYEKHINMDENDFKEQNYRNIVHNLFNVVVTQFNKKDTYINICNDITYNISDTYYKNAINKAKFTCYKGLLAKYSLKFKLFFLIWLYNKYHNK